jgi:UDP-N-acetyl-D-galactosamine dehydrogenase
MLSDNNKIAVIGLGYVDLPLAVEFGKLRSVIGFDINAQRIAELQAGRDLRFECRLIS